MQVTPNSRIELWIISDEFWKWVCNVYQVFQRRQDGSVNFYRGWDSYKKGFPDAADGELWLGNEKLYYLTNQSYYEMRIDLVTGDDVSYNLNYDAFRISNEDGNYALATLGRFTGNTGGYMKKLIKQIVMIFIFKTRI